MVKERTFKRPLKFFTREFGVQYFEFVKHLKTLPWWDVEELVKTKNIQQCLWDLKTLPWWDVEELVKTKNIQQCLWGPEVRLHERKLWYYIRAQANAGVPEWKPHYPKRTIKIDPVTGEKGITLHVKIPRCMNNMLLKEMEQDFYKEFKGSIYDPMTCQAVIALQDKDCVWRQIRVLDPMRLVNCSKKDIECLFFNKIMYYEADKEQPLQYQKLVGVCFEKEINSGHYLED
ncbi:hypothetical protein Hanom_Chr14g01261051 [Helianthus anomalus]